MLATVIIIFSRKTLQGFLQDKTQAFQASRICPSSQGHSSNYPTTPYQQATPHSSSVPSCHSWMPSFLVFPLLAHPSPLPIGFSINATSSVKPASKFKGRINCLVSWASSASSIDHHYGLDFSPHNSSCEVGPPGIPIL